MRVSIEIPDEIFREAELAAVAEHISVEQLLGSAASDHLAAWKSLKGKAAQGNLKDFQALMAQVPNVEPENFDRL